MQARMMLQRKIDPLYQKKQLHRLKKQATGFGKATGNKKQLSKKQRTKSLKPDAQGAGTISYLQMQ